ncbi:glycoside hydrolase family 16 protein [Nonomuraea ferruginea]
MQTFFTITPLRFNLDPDYGELDFEYLPNGGWGEPSNILYATSWETYQGEPWQAVNTHTEERASFAGWHDLVIQVSGGRIKYYVDGRLFADHGGIHYPETPMWIMFNQWFIDLQAATGTRTYRQQVDWVYHARNEVVSPSRRAEPGRRPARRGHLVPRHRPQLLRERDEAPTHRRGGGPGPGRGGVRLGRRDRRGAREQRPRRADRLDHGRQRHAGPAQDVRDRLRGRPS